VFNYLEICMSWMISLAERRRKLWWLQVVQDWRLLDASEGQQKPQPKSKKVARTGKTSQWFFTRYISILRTFQNQSISFRFCGEVAKLYDPAPVSWALFGTLARDHSWNSSVAQIIVSMSCKPQKMLGRGADDRWCSYAGCGQLGQNILKLTMSPCLPAA
jgi:hypothetical protein